MNPILTKSYQAGAIVNPCRFVKHGAADYAAIQAVDAAAAILGVSEQNMVAPAGHTFDVIKAGIAMLELGGAVTRGNVLIPDAVGRGVAASVVAGTEQHVGAIAEVSGVEGDIIPVLVVAGAVIATDTGIIQRDVTVSSAELLALNAAVKELVPAPGAGFAVLVEDAQLFLDYNSAAYAGIAAGEDLALKYSDDAGAQIAAVETTGFLDATSDQYRHVRPTTTAAFAPIANAPVVLHMLSGEITTGNSPLKVRVRYRVAAVSW